MWLPFFTLAIVFHCIIFALFFLRRKGGIGHSNFLLATFLFLLSVITLPFAIKPTGWIEYLPYLTDLEWSCGFLMAPVYYWYVREMIGEQISYRHWKEWILLLPPVAAFLFFGRFYLWSAQEQQAYIHLIRTTYITAYEITDVIFYVYIQSYFILLLILLSRRSKVVSGIFLDNLHWLKKYTLLLLGFGFLGMGLFLLRLPQAYIDILPLASSCLYMTLIYRFLLQSGQHFDKKQNIQKTKYAGSGLKTDEGERLNQLVLHSMEVKHSYLNPELNINLLADEIGTSSHFLSQVINQFHQKKFTDFINTYRIKAAQYMIEKERQLKLEVIGYECGFNTKTTFNTAFKKWTGCTPGEYRRQIEAQYMTEYRNE